MDDMRTDKMRFELVEQIHNDLEIPMDAESITADYYLMHYKEILPRYISQGHPSRDTIYTYCVTIDSFIRWCLRKQRHPLLMTDYQMRIYIDDLYKQGYKNDSIGLKATAIRAFYYAAHKIGVIKSNPMSDIKTPSSGSQEEFIKFFSLEQLSDILESIERIEDDFVRTRDTLILYLMAVEGLRRVEVQRANVEDIDFSINSMIVRGKARTETIAPCEATMNAAMAYLQTIHGSVLKDGLLTPLIVSNSSNNFKRRISRIGLNWIIDSILENESLKHKGVSCHALRHSCGTNLYQKTKDLLVVQKVLRQRDPKVTSRYAHVNEQISKRVTSVLDIKKK